LELTFFPSSFKESKKNVKIDGNKISFYGAYGSVNNKIKRKNEIKLNINFKIANFNYIRII
jgi:hypothetical protein